MWTHLQEDTQFWAILFDFRMRGGRRFPRASAHRLYRIPTSYHQLSHRWCWSCAHPYRVSLFQPLHVPLAMFEHHSERAWGFELSVFGWHWAIVSGSLHRILANLCPARGRKIFWKWNPLGFKPAWLFVRSFICFYNTLVLNILHMPTPIPGVGAHRDG